MSDFTSATCTSSIWDKTHTTAAVDWDYTLSMAASTPYNTSDIASDSCSCPGSGVNFEINLSDSCQISSCTAGNVTFVDTGTAYFNGTNNFEDFTIPSGETVYLNSSSTINLGVTS